nr:hypothetical protein [Chromobacterium haemolyticum]
MPASGLARTTQGALMMAKASPPTVRPRLAVLRWVMTAVIMSPPGRAMSISSLTTPGWMAATLPAN